MYYWDSVKKKKFCPIGTVQKKKEMTFGTVQKKKEMSYYWDSVEKEEEKNLYGLLGQCRKRKKFCTIGTVQ